MIRFIKDRNARRRKRRNLSNITRYMPQFIVTYTFRYITILQGWIVTYIEDLVIFERSHGQ